VSKDDLTTYLVTEFDPQEPSSTFKFVPPADAKLIAAFPKPSFEAELETSSLIGKPAPELSLKFPDGKIVTLSGFRGKPVFLEFWATWCEPCVDLIPDLTKLYSETAEKGLVWLSIDSDEDPATAASFLAQEHVRWPNYHDGDGSLGKAFHLDGIPLAVLIDADGKVTFQRSGYEIPELRNAIAKLGPQFSPVASSASKPQ
jgi:thiol-disulfide isomerase/thioredoxin